MPGQLTTESDREARRSGAPITVGLGQFLIALAGVAAAGAVAGVLWEWVWSPPAGVVAGHRWVLQDESSLRAEFSGTGWYVVIATVVGLVAGAGVALALDRVPVLTLVGVVLGSVAGTWLMVKVGTTLGPPDPATLARTARNGTRLPGDLDVAHWSPLISLPVGALVGLALVFVGLSTRRGRG